MALMPATARCQQPAGRGHGHAARRPTPKRSAAGFASIGKKKRKPKTVTFKSDEWIPIAHNGPPRQLFVMTGSPDEDGLCDAQFKISGEFVGYEFVMPLGDLLGEMTEYKQGADEEARRHDETAHTLDVIVSNMHQFEIMATLSGLDPDETQACEALATRLKAISDEKRSKAEAMSDEELRSVVQDADGDDQLKSIAEDEQQRREEQQDESG